MLISTATLSGATAPWLPPSLPLTSSKIPFMWSPAADRSFSDLKHRCIGSPQPPSYSIPTCSFSSWWRSMFERSALDQKLHPCTFLSNRLYPTERNYDFGNQELLAVKMVLEEWRHLLEWPEHPFLVWTDHKRLNSRQARWALLFTRFNFTISFCTSSKSMDLWST